MQQFVWVKIIMKSKKSLISQHYPSFALYLILYKNNLGLVEFNFSDAGELPCTPTALFLTAFGWGWEKQWPNRRICIQLDVDTSGEHKASFKDGCLLAGLRNLSKAPLWEPQLPWHLTSCSPWINCQATYIFMRKGVH